MAHREAIYAERNNRVQEVCKEYSNVYENPVQGKTLWFDLNDHLAICMHAKVRRTVIFETVSKAQLTTFRLAAQH